MAAIMPWLYLGLGIVSEILCAICMKLSDGNTKTIPTVGMFVFAGLMLFFASKAVPTLGVSLVYPIWAGIGTVAVALIGITFFGEAFSLTKGIAIALVVLGVVLLKMDSNM